MSGIQSEGLNLRHDCKALSKKILWALVALSFMNISVAQQTREQAQLELERLGSVIASAPSVAQLYVERGDVLSLLNDHHRAVADYSTALTLDDKQDRAYFGRGMAYGLMGLIDDGIADLSVYIQRNPNDSVAYTKRGVRNIWSGNLTAAEHDLIRAVTLDPNNAEAHDDLGVVHAKRRNLRQAAQHFSTAIKLDPSYQKAYHNLAICFHMGGRYDAALEIVDAGLSLDQDNRSSLLLKSAILQALGRGLEARKIADHAEFLPEDNWTERSNIEHAPTAEKSK